MFRYITAILLLTAFAAQTFQQADVVLGYYANNESYAKNCENKAKPMMHCNGKCQLMKKLQEQEKKDKQSPERKLENKSEVVSSKSFFSGVFLASIADQSSFSFGYASSKLQSRPTATFRPPCLI